MRRPCLLMLPIRGLRSSFKRAGIREDYPHFQVSRKILRSRQMWNPGQIERATPSHVSRSFHCTAALGAANPTRRHLSENSPTEFNISCFLWLIFHPIAVGFFLAFFLIFTLVFLSRCRTLFDVHKGTTPRDAVIRLLSRMLSEATTKGPCRAASEAISLP